MLKSTKWSAKKEFKDISQLKTIFVVLMFFGIFYAEEKFSKEEKRLDELVKTVKEGLAEIEKTVKDKKRDDKEIQVKPQVPQIEKNEKISKAWEFFTGMTTIFLKIVELPIILLESLFYIISEISINIRDVMSKIRTFL
jgi:hypothetical protein